MTYTNSPELFIRNIAESMENQHYMQTPGQYITEAFVNEALKGYDRVDEGFMDVMKTLLKPITWPIAKIADFWKKDREFVNEVSKAEKAIPKHVVAALYSEEFADTNIVQDLWDMLCMLKDVVLFRYRHIPWRTAISAAGLVLYYLSPWNQTWGTALASWLKGLGVGNGDFGAGFLGDGHTSNGADAGAPLTTGNGTDVQMNPNKFTYDNVDFSDWDEFNADGLPVDKDGRVLDPGSFAPAAWNSPEYEFPADQKFNIAGNPVDDNGKALPLDMFHKAGTSGGEGVGSAGSATNNTVNIGNAAKLDPDVAVDPDSGMMVVNTKGWTTDEPLPIGTSYTNENGRQVTIVGYAQEKFNGHLCNVPLLDINGDGRPDVADRPDAEEVAEWGKPQVSESLTGLAIGGLAAAGAAITGTHYWRTNKAEIVEAANKAAPYLNFLDELLITYLLWKWFKKDLKDYRKWLVTKDEVKRARNGEPSSLRRI